MDRDDQSGAVSHPLELALLKIRRQALVARSCISAMKRLPGEIVGVVGMSADKPKQALMEHLIERGAGAEQRPLLRRNAETEQQRRSPRHHARQWRMKQSTQAIQRLLPLRRIDGAVQQRFKIDPGNLCDQMRKTDEAPEHAVPIEAVREIGMPRPADDVALVPIGVCGSSRGRNRSR